MAAAPPSRTTPETPGPGSRHQRLHPQAPIFPKGDSLMGAMDLLVNEVEGRFGLSGGKASSLLTAILSLIQEQSGGLSGFLEKFRRAGLSDTVSSWLTGGTPTPVSADSL